MNGKKSNGHDAELLCILRGWQELESKAVASAYDMMSKTSNPLVKMIMDLIMHDSEKHKLVLQMIIDSLTREAIYISPDEFRALSEKLNRHMETEQEAIRLAQAALDKCTLVSTHFLLSYLIADEKKHHNLMARLDELSIASIPTAVSAGA